MTDDDRKPGAGWDLVEDLIAEEEIQRGKAMPAEERRAEMKARGLDPDRADAIANEVLAKLGYETATAAPAAAPVPAPKVVSLAAEREKRRPARPTWVIALVAAAALVVLVGGGGAVVAVNWPSPSATTSVPQVPTAPPGPSPEQLAQEQRAKADELRKVAAVECAAEKWGKCDAHLKDASKLDPQGDEARRVQRLQSKASRGLILEQLEAKEAPGRRVLLPEANAIFVARLATSKGQALHVVCVQGAEPSHLCDQLVAAITKGGWVVTRTNVAADAGVTHGMLIEIASDADDATEAAADTLATGLEWSNLFARGPNDAAPGGDAPLRLTVGSQ
jgi:hypothetical protein